MSDDNRLDLVPLSFDPWLRGHLSLRSLCRCRHASVPPKQLDNGHSEQRQVLHCRLQGIDLHKCSDEKARYVRKRVHETEKNMAAVKLSLGNYLHQHESISQLEFHSNSKSVEMRGRRLDMALSLKAFSEFETLNLKSALINSAEAFVELEDHHKYMVSLTTAHSLRESVAR